VGELLHRMEDHRHPPHRQQVLVGDLGQRKEARARPAGEDDALHRAPFPMNQARRKAAKAIRVLTTPGMAPAVQGESPPPSEMACAITEAAQRIMVNAMPTATAPASGTRRRGRSMPSARPIAASAAGTTCTGCAARSASASP